MKKTLPILLLFLSIISTSCSSESTEEDNSSGSPDSGKLVEKEFVSDNYNLQYRYNNSQLLSQITDILLEEEIHDIITFKYDAKGNVVERNHDSQNSSYRSLTTFQYDNQDRIISSESTSTMNNSNTSLKFSYSGNSVEVVEIYRGYEYITNLELNARGLVTKISEGEGYSTFEYDSQNNLKKIQTYNEAGDLKFTHQYMYDDKPNPFFGQLKSLYLPKFIDIMEDLSYGENIFYPYQGYLLPYSKNNIKQVTYSAGDPNWNPKKDYSYSYDTDGYPSEVTESWNGNASFAFDIIYK